MRTLTEREKRTVRLAAIGVAGYLAVFYGRGLLGKLGGGRSEYLQLKREAQTLRRELLPYETRVLQIEKLRDSFQIDPPGLNPESLMGLASAAIQDAARSSGLELGPIRETPGRSSGKELASVQLEGMGPVAAVLTLLHRIDRLGYPLVVDSVQINAEPSNPNAVKLTLQVIILNFDQWKAEDTNRA